jgi:hypothetical protein
MSAIYKSVTAAVGRLVPRNLQPLWNHPAGRIILLCRDACELHLLAAADFIILRSIMLFLFSVILMYEIEQKWHLRKTVFKKTGLLAIYFKPGECQSCEPCFYE